MGLPVLARRSGPRAPAAPSGPVAPAGPCGPSQPASSSSCGARDDQFCLCHDECLPTVFHEACRTVLAIVKSRVVAGKIRMPPRFSTKLKRTTDFAWLDRSPPSRRAPPALPVQLGGRMLATQQDVTMTPKHQGGLHATDCNQRRLVSPAARRHARPGASTELDAAAGKRALPIEMGRERRARLRQPHEAADRAQRGQADQNGRSHRDRPRAEREHAVLRHAALRRAHQAHLHEPAVQQPRQQRGDGDFGDRPGRHPVRRLRPPDPRQQPLQLLQGR